MFSDMIQMFQSVVNVANEGKLDSATNRIKLFMYADHMETILNFANAFRFTFPEKFVDYSSVILIELHKIDSNFYVNVSINGNEVYLPG